MPSTAREQIARLATATPARPLPDFPRFPDSAKKRLGKDVTDDIDDWEKQIAEFFKQLKTQGSIR